jgi:hypothetical protein
MTLDNSTRLETHRNMLLLSQVNLKKKLKYESSDTMRKGAF